MTYESLIPHVEIINLKKLRELVKIDSKTLDSLTYNSLEQNDDMPVAYFKKDITIEGNLDLDTLFDELFIGSEKNFDFREKGYAYGTISLVWISGSLTVSNTLTVKETEDYSQWLIVENNVSTKNIVQGGISFIFLSDLKVDQIFYYKSGAQGWMTRKGESDIKFEVDNNFCWSIKDKGFDNSEYELYPPICDQILVNPLDYVTTDDEGDEFFWGQGESDFISDLLDDKPIFKM